MRQLVKAGAKRLFAMENVYTAQPCGKILNPQLAEKLVRILGMLGSDHDGERANAAALASRMVRKLGITWADLISKPEPESLSELCAWLLVSDLLTIWEYGFVSSLRAPLSPKQRDKLNAITAKVRAYERRNAI